MKTNRFLLPLLVMFIAALACNFPEEADVLLPETTASPPGLHSIVVNPTRGRGQFDFTLYYRTGDYLGYFTCAYLKDPQKDTPIIIAVAQTEGLSEIAPYDGKFTEDRPGIYTAYCAMGSEQVETKFTVISPFAGTYSCQECISPLWSEEVTMITEAPRRMGGTKVTVSIAEDGTVTGGNIYLEIFGTPPDYCVITRYVFEAVQATGAVNPDTKETIVDFIKGTETYERSGGSGCEAPQTIVQPAMRYYFIFNDLGDLLLCSPEKQGHECYMYSYAVLEKQE